MYDGDMIPDEGCLMIILKIVGLILTMAIVPIIGSLAIWAEAWIVSQLVGSFICDSLALLGLYFLPSQLPKLFLGISWVGYFFLLGTHSIAYLMERFNNLLGVSD